MLIPLQDLLRPLDKYVRPVEDMKSRAQVYRSRLTQSFQAEIFVPQYLQSIQQQPHNFEPIHPVPIFPSPRYATTFLPSTLCRLPAQPALLASAPREGRIPKLEYDTYHRHFLPLLQWELAKTIEDKASIVIWKTSIAVTNWSNAEFCIIVPGIRENYPKLEIGDLLHLREVIEQTKSGTGRAFEGRVSTLRKREGIVSM